MRKKFIIVGQGLAGSLLGIELIKREQQVLVIDNKWQGSASTVAAGMWNPINFRKLTYSWRAPEFISKLYNHYTQLEDLLNVQLVYSKPIVKKIPDKNTLGLLDKQCEEINAFIAKDGSAEGERLFGSEGYFALRNTGVLDVKELLRASKDFFKYHKVYQEGEFDWSKLDDPEAVYISCEGYKAKDNPYFTWLPLNANKGHILDVYPPEFWQSNEILNCGKFLFKAPDGSYKAGATYNWNDVDFIPEDDASKEILAPFLKVSRDGLRVKEIKVGLRPTIADRRPVLGHHPIHKNIAIFGALGTKGVMLAPSFVGEMADLLIHQRPCDQEVSIMRFVKKYYDHKD